MSKDGSDHLHPLPMIRARVSEDLTGLVDNDAEANFKKVLDDKRSKNLQRVKTKEKIDGI